MLFNLVVILHRQIDVVAVVVGLFTLIHPTDRTMIGHQVGAREGEERNPLGASRIVVNRAAIGTTVPRQGLNGDNLWLIDHFLQFFNGDLRIETGGGIFHGVVLRVRDKY